jgi:aryl-alcohol dehydrogenase-like predicted oxidoreductase
VTPGARSGPPAGARTAAQLEENLGCLNLVLPESETAWLNEVSNPGLPHPRDFLAQYGPWR